MIINFNINLVIKMFCTTGIKVTTIALLLPTYFVWQQRNLLKSILRHITKVSWQIVFCLPLLKNFCFAYCFLFLLASVGCFLSICFVPCAVKMFHLVLPLTCEMSFLGLNKLLKLVKNLNKIAQRSAKMGGFKAKSGLNLGPTHFCLISMHPTGLLLASNWDRPIS